MRSIGFGHWGGASALYGASYPRTFGLGSSAGVSPLPPSGPSDLLGRLRAAISAWDAAADSVRAGSSYVSPELVTRRTPGAPGESIGNVLNQRVAAGTKTTLGAIRKINDTTTTTVRSSARTLGLDHGSLQAASVRAGTGKINTETSAARASSAALRLFNTTSDETASVVTGTAQINTARSTSRLSTTTLGFDVSTPASPSTLASTAQVNTSTSSYDKVRLTFDSGTSAANLSGVYAGSDSELKIRFQTTTSLSSSVATAMKFEVRNDANDVVFAFDGALKAGEAVDIAGTGLLVTFEAGTTLQGQTSTVTNVSATTPTSVDPSAVFNAVDVNARPRFDPGQAASAGSFQVNGTNVDVFADDTINSVLARITSTASGVTASFADDRVTLTSSSGSDPITVGGDTSGFLAAVKLAGATTTPGVVRDDRQTFANSSKLGSVTTGSFDVNGTTISVDRAVDTLESVLARINASNAGVRIGYEVGRDRVSLSPTVAGARVVLDNDTSGFFDAIKLETGARGTAALGDKAFDGTGSNDPMFDAGHGVTAGAFTINGKTIDVAANDTINSVLAKITSSAAGVTAALDGDRVTLTTTQASDQDIAFGADTSGFLAAVKLANAPTARGNVRDQNQTFATSMKLGGVVSGSFRVNGAIIAVDRAADSLTSVVDKINAAGAGVTAAYDRELDTLSITPDSPGASLVLDQDSSGFFAATNLAVGSTGTSARVNAAFDGGAADVPLLDPGQAVTAGSFLVNGVAIAVAGNDSITSVLAKITASSAGVTATLSDDRVTLTSKTASDAEIRLEGDTSGFVAAMKLGDAETVRGQVRDTGKALTRVTGFGGIDAGSFRVNGVVIAVDPNTDTLDNVLARMSAPETGVAASYDASSDRIVVAPRTAGATLVLDQDTSGFLASAQLDVGAWGTTVNLDGAFDGHFANDARLGPGKSVTAGSFTVNGVRIDVEGNDSIRSVLDEINASDAGVNATFDVATQRLKLVAKLIGDAPITLGPDSSGFLAATKLDTAILTRGEQHEISVVDATLSSAFPDVQSGTMSINGHDIAVNRDVDTIRSVLRRIDEVDGLHATTGHRRNVSIRAESPGSALDITDETGFLASIGVATGRFEGQPDVETTALEGGDTLLDPAGSARALAAAFNGLNDALAGSGDTPSADRIALQNGVRLTLEKLGFKGALVIGNTNAPGVAVSEHDVEHVLRTDPHAFDTLLGGGGVRDALDEIAKAVESAKAASDATPDPNDGPRNAGPSGEVLKWAIAGMLQQTAAETPPPSASPYSWHALAYARTSAL